MKFLRILFLVIIVATLGFIGYQLYEISQKLDKNNTTEVSQSTLSLVSPTPAVEDPSAIGNVTGKICYPSEQIPPLTIYLKNIDTNEYLEQQVPLNSSTYNFSGITAGQYIAFAYLQSNSSSGGSYSAAVPCGLTVACTDHTPLEFDVTADTTTTGIDICDWYSPDDVPPAPAI